MCQNCHKKMEENSKRSESYPIKVTYTTKYGLKCPLCRLDGFAVKIFK